MGKYSIVWYRSDVDKFVVSGAHSKKKAKSWSSRGPFEDWVYVGIMETGPGVHASLFGVVYGREE